MGRSAKRIESKDDAEERARIWRLIEKAIPKEMRKYFPNLTIGDIPGVIRRVLELKSKTSGQEDEETHEKWKSLKFANTGNNRLDWAVFFAEYNELILKFDKIADKPSEGRKMLRVYQQILLKDDRTKMLATQVKLNSPEIESDDLMKKVNDLCKAVFSEDAYNFQAEALVADDAENVAHALFAGTSTKKACYHLAIGRKCFKGDKCGYSHDDDDVQRFKKILEGRKKDVKCHKCGELGHVKAQCKASASTTQGSIDDAKTQTTTTKAGPRRLR